MTQTQKSVKNVKKLYKRVRNGIFHTFIHVKYHAYQKCPYCNLYLKFVL